jgi:hypothetical protein
VIGSQRSGARAFWDLREGQYFVIGLSRDVHVQYSSSSWQNTNYSSEARLDKAFPSLAKPTLR